MLDILRFLDEETIKKYLIEDERGWTLAKNAPKWVKEEFEEYLERGVLSSDIEDDG